MRRFLSLFMVLLLALRGLAGDAMAMEQSSAPAHHMTQEQSGVQSHKPSHSHAQTVDEMAAMAQHLHHDMGSHHEAALNTAITSAAISVAASVSACNTDTPNSASNPNNDCHQHESHCTACGICHSTLATPELLQQQVSTEPALPLIHGAARFASAGTFELIKPPISAL
ncbi:hypothetical protein KUF54_09845 [Comamonas sp. Y33R10-2]|uniref:hypothetical protein n=1 Tax=Comamonas sp. Y33R10-2 TaxID=2853257 RepID=UPI001C5CABAC|nr:hypothetical protein [Comamonas sp. Y33R10-2]QXZ08409.1 hypothetical protein KUF54_09845 [Comamonas sp. Y33R10-2]